MKLILVLMLCAAVAAAPGSVKFDQIERHNSVALAETPDTHNLLVNALVRQLIAYVRRIVNNGSDLFGIPPLDPLALEHFHLELPLGLINLVLELKDIFATGFGGFVVHRSNLNLRDLTFDLDVSVPRVDISTQYYDLLGDLLSAIPLYGKGKAKFEVVNFRFQALLILKQSEDGKSVVIERIENAAFQIPSFKSEISGAIGGGEIDKIVNAMAEDVIMDYVNRFQGALSLVAAQLAHAGLNPILERLDTWRYIAPLIPRAL